MTECGELRKLMIKHQVTRRGVHGRALLDAMQAVPREEFVESDLEGFAYDDSPLAIGHGQTISQPYIVARMLDEADIKPSDVVLEIGVGSGYAAAVASRMAAHVYGIERIFALSKQTRKTLDRLHYDNIDIRTGDGTTGWSEAGP